MAIVLFKKGTGQQVKMNEFGFEGLIQAGEYFFTKEEALKAIEQVEKSEKTQKNYVAAVAEVKPTRKIKKRGRKSSK